MERIITFIAEHKKREYEQMKEDPACETLIPQESKDTVEDPEPLTTE